MIEIAKDIQSLSHFKRNTAHVMKQMRKSGKPVVLTVNGKAEVVVQDAAAYQRLMARAEKTEMMEFLREAKADGDAGRTVPARDFLQSLGQKKETRSGNLRLNTADAAEVALQIGKVGAIGIGCFGIVCGVQVETAQFLWG